MEVPPWTNFEANGANTAPSAGLIKITLQQLQSGPQISFLS